MNHKYRQKNWKILCNKFSVLGTK